MRNPLTLPFLSPLAPYGWPIVRFVAGVLLATHGWAKVTGGVEGFAGWLGSMHVPSPEIAAWASALAELVGGGLLAIGLFTRLAGLVVAFNMVVALYLAHRDDFALIGSGKNSPAEYPILLAAVGVCALFAGAERCSVDAILAKKHVP